MSAQYGHWTSFDKATDQSLIVAAWRSGKISGSQAWDLHVRYELWVDKDVAFASYVLGQDAAATGREIRTRSSHLKAVIKRLIMLAKTHELISAQSVDWMFYIFDCDEA